MLQTLRISWVVLTLSACAVGDVASGPNEEFAGHALEITSTEARPLPLGGESLIELTRATRVHIFEFELTGQARLELAGTLLAYDAPIDMSLELSRVTQRGRKLIVRERAELTEQDHALLLRQVLHAGRHRLVVSAAAAPRTPGHGRELRDFMATLALLGSCTGAGCPAPVLPEDPSAGCLFGAVFSDIRSNPALSLRSEVWLRDVLALDALTAEQLLRAVQQSSHTDVTTAAEALARVDQQEVRRIELTEVASGREFVVYEYGVGDNSYGAFFARDAAEVVASIHDGDLLDCQVAAADGGDRG
jgi:hypothetical protein